MITDMGWVRRWRVEVRIRVGFGDRTEPRRADADDVAGARRLIERARANPDVAAAKVVPVDELDGSDRPQVCWACGGELEPERIQHAATKRSKMMTQVTCRACPGHERIRCPGCDRVTVWPTASRECGPPVAEWEWPMAEREWRARGR